MREKKISFYFLLTLVICSIYFVYWAEKKDLWFCDEVFTYESANAPGERNPFGLEENEGVWMSGTDASSFLGAKGHEFKYKEIANYLYSDHVPLYFWLFHSISIFFSGSCSIWIGLLLNMFFYLLLSGLLWYIGFNISENYIISTLITLTVCFHPLVILQALTLRMYLMLSICIIYSFFFLWRWDVTEKNTKRKYMLMVYGLVSMGLLTHYHYWLFLGCLFFLCGVKLLLRYRWKDFFVLFGIFMAAMGTVTVIFPKWRINLQDGKGKLGVEKIISLEGLKADFCTTFNTFRACIFGNNISIVLASLIILFLFGFGLYLAVSFQREYLWLFLGVGASFLFLVIISHTIPAFEERYYWPGSTFLLFLFALLFFMIIKYIHMHYMKEEKKWIFVVVSAIMVVLCLNMAFKYFDGKTTYLKARPSEQKEILLKYQNVPWLVLYDTLDWETYCAYYDFIIPEQICWITSNSQGEKDKVLEETDKVVAYVRTGLENGLQHVLDYMGECTEQDTQLKAEIISHSMYMDIYLIEKY